MVYAANAVVLLFLNKFSLVLPSGLDHYSIYCSKHSLVQHSQDFTLISSIHRQEHVL